MFRIDKNTKTDSTSISANPGINDNFKLAKVEKKQLDSGKIILNFDFKRLNGEYFSHTEWEPNPDDARYEDKLDWLTARVGHILRKYLSEEDSIISADNWESFCDGVVNAMKKADLEQLMRLKITLNNKNKNQFPLFPNFIEHQTAAATSLRLTDKDVIHATQPTDILASENTPLEEKLSF